jgi:hypothetical protein
MVQSRLTAVAGRPPYRCDTGVIAGDHPTDATLSLCANCPVVLSGFPCAL